MGDWYDTQEQTSLDEAAAVRLLAEAEIVLLGERHDRAADHLWQARLIAALADRGAAIVGVEMLPVAAQPLLDAWISGRLAEPAFLVESRWQEVWGFDFALYAPIFRLCRDRRIRMRALNVDRPVVSLIGREGWEAMPAALRPWLSPAAPAAAAYRRYLFEATGGARPDRTARSPDDPAFDRFVRAQQTWDRAFACRLAAASQEAPGARVIGVIGRGHLEHGYGTPAQLADLGVERTVVALPDGDITTEPPLARLICRRTAT
jgi:uncharacterized iron-regulated protein